MGKGNKNQTKKKSKWEKVQEANSYAWGKTWNLMYDVEDKFQGLVTRPFSNGAKTAGGIFGDIFKHIGLPVVLVALAFGVGLYFLTTRNQAAIVATANAAGKFALL